MNSKTWKTLYQDSDKLSKPAQVKGLIPNKDITEIKLLLIAVLNGFLEKKEPHLGLKTYINNTLRNDLIDKMVTHPPKQEFSLEQWTQQIFGDQKFGMILNGLEAYSNNFAEKAATIVRPLLENAGLPLNGLSFLFFMGNYGFTPFGIHKESTGEDGVLFHLGPENKEFYTWDNPKYNGIAHQSKVFHNVSEMLSDGKKYDLAPGDAMFIPHYVYHIGNTPQFSLSFVLDYINPPKDRFENELIKQTAEEGLLNHKNYTLPLKMDATTTELNNVLNVESLQKKLNTTFARNILSLKSNGGFRKKSNIIKSTIPPTQNFSIQGKAIFPIYMDIKDSEKHLIYARGHRLEKKAHPKMPELLNQLNMGDKITFNAIKKLMQPLWDLIEIYGLIHELLQVEAILLEDVKNVN